MSNENAPPTPQPAAPAAAPAAAPKKGGATMMLIGVAVSAVLSGGAAFGGARAATRAPSQQETASAHVHPPGPTVSLEPFLASVIDTQGKMHAVKLTLAIELGREAKEDEFKTFIPRVRDAINTYLRTMTYEKLADSDGVEILRKDLLERLRTVGADAAEQILVTDLITQ